MTQFKGLLYLAVGFVFLSCLLCDVEARRKVLRGRKVFTRAYYSKPLLPIWAKIILIGFGILLSGGLIYFLLWRFLVVRAQNSSKKDTLLYAR